MPPAAPNFPDEEWDALLANIEQGKVIPVVGDGAMTFGPDNQPLQPALAKELQRELAQKRAGVRGSLPPEALVALVASLRPAGTLNDVVCEHLLLNGKRNAIYFCLDSILRRGSFAPGQTLRELAEIEALSLYISTTFDSLLKDAIGTARNRGCAVAGFSPEALEKDLPRRAAELEGPTVYHLLGKSSAAPGEFVAWEEDLLDFLSALPRHLGSDTMRNLSADLRTHSVLAVGLQFSDWVLRLLLRVARQEALSSVKFYSWLAEGAATQLTPATVLFFSSVSQNIKMIDCDAPSFVAELHRRWRERHPPSPSPAPVGGLQP